jgi:Cdc6-like AAA superfamily ATPase
VIESSFKRLNGFPANIYEVRDRKEKVKKIIVEHPRYEKIQEKIEEIHILSRGSVQADNLFLYGGTGVGKSTILREYTDKFSRKIIEGNTKIPILYFRVPVGATPKSVASSMLLAMKDPNYDKGAESNQTDRILNFVEKCGVEMVIIDEFQHLIDRDTNHVLNRASDWVKKFSEDVNIPIILAGMTESKKIFRHNDQLDRRFTEKVEMKGFDFSTHEDQIEFRVFLNSIDEQLPFAERANLGDVKMAERFFYASNGNPYYVNKILQEATVFAAKSGNDKIDLNHLYSAFNLIKIAKRPNVINPFGIDMFDLVEATDLEERKNKNSAS